MSPLGSSLAPCLSPVHTAPCVTQPFSAGEKGVMTLRCGRGWWLSSATCLILGPARMVISLSQTGSQELRDIKLAQPHDQ